MKADNLRARLRTRAGMILVGTLCWLILTATLGALVIYTDRSLDGLIGFHINTGLAFAGALVIGALFGSIIEHGRLLVAAIVLSCATAAGMYAAVLFTPVWTGVIVSTPGLENMATTRAIVHFGLITVPTGIGAVLGRLVGPLVPGGDLLREPGERDKYEWWLPRSRQTGERPSRHRSM